MTPAARLGLAAIGDGAGGLAIEQIEVRAPAAGEVRVRLSAAGICHTDQASLSWPGPLVLGHEGAGVVDALGAGVAHLHAGQPVLLNWAIPCGHCPQCRRGRGALCERTQGVDASLGSSRAGAGHTRWRGQDVQRSFNLGTFAEYTLVRAEALTPLPQTLPMRCACILGCGVMTGVGAVINIAAVQPGDSVAVVGCGGNAVQLSGAHGPVTVDMPQFWWDKKYLVPLYGGCLPERDFPRLIDWAASGQLRLASMVTHTYCLAQLQQALDDMLAGRSAKGVILFDAP